jgi:ABC-type transporter Mla subunit MlaD
MLRGNSRTDWGIALTVVICAAILLAALAFALSHKHLGRPAGTLRVQFADATGVSVNSGVRFAGARIGTVREIRILSPGERAAGDFPGSAVELVLGIDRPVSFIPSDASVSISADTLLSDKFVLIGGGTPTAPSLSDNALLQGITPVPIDQLARTANRFLLMAEGFFGSGESGADSILEEIRLTLGEARALIASGSRLVEEAETLTRQAGALVQEGNKVLGEAGNLTRDGRNILAENREPLQKAIQNLQATTEKARQLTGQADTFLSKTERELGPSLENLRITSENFRLLSTEGRFFLRNLQRRPQQIIWGNRSPREFPAEEAILSSPGRFPVD